MDITLRFGRKIPSSNLGEGAKFKIYIPPLAQFPPEADQPQDGVGPR